MTEPIPYALALLGRLVLAILALYHIVTGVVALLAPERARKLMSVLYGAELQASAQLDYATAMIGAQALAIGALAAVASLDPLAHGPIVAALAGLQLLRAGVRIARRRTLHESLGAPPGRNAVAVGVLFVESALLIALYVGITLASASETAVVSPPTR